MGWNTSIEFNGLIAAGTGLPSYPSLNQRRRNFSIRWYFRSRLSQAFHIRLMGGLKAQPLILIHLKFLGRLINCQCYFHGRLTSPFEDYFNACAITLY